VRAPRPVDEPARLAALQRYGVVGTPAEPGFDRLVRIAARALEAPVALIGLVDQDRVWIKAQVGLARETLDRDAAFCAYTILDDEPLIISDARDDDRFLDLPLVIGPSRLRFYAGAPLRTHDGFRIGALAVLDQRWRTLDPAQITLLRDLAAAAVDQIELRDARRTTALFDRVIQVSPDSVYVFDVATLRNVYASRSLEAMLGYPTTGMTRGDLMEKIHPDDRSQVRAGAAAITSAVDGAVVQRTFRIRDAYDTYRWLLTRDTPFQRDAAGAVTQYAGVITDVTELKEAEAMLEESEATLADRLRVLEGILASAGDAIVVVDEQGRYEVFNDAAVRILGRGPREVPPLERPRAYGLFELDRTTPLPLEHWPLVRALRGDAVDGQTFWLRNDAVPDGVFLSATTRPLRDRGGRVRGAVGVFTDVTALKQAKVDLERSHDQLAARVHLLETIFDASDQGIVVVDEHGTLTLANSIARGFTGLAPGDRPASTVGVWPAGTTIFRADGKTPMAIEELPLSRALRGEPSDAVEILVKNAAFPAGVQVQGRGRPLRDDRGAPRGALVTFSDISELTRIQAQLGELIVTDELTGLTNRRGLRQRLDLLDAEAARGRRFAIAVCDLDHFKRINDEHGHDAGDRVLRAAAHTLRRSVRRNDLVARLGGAEFCIVFADVDEAHAVRLLERVRLALAATDAPVKVTASFGVCHSSTAPGSDAMIARADAALYRAKRDGRDRVAIADHDGAAPSR
jgi:diguanylate cyclase